MTIEPARARGRNRAAERTSLSEIDIRNKILILDRGFFSEDVMQFLDGSDCTFQVSPLFIIFNLSNYSYLHFEALEYIK